MIKFGKRHNLIYPLIFSIFNSMRKLDSIIMKKYINFSGCTFLTIIMFFSDFISGLILYLYYLKNSEQKESTSSFMGIELIHADNEISPSDNSTKILILIMFASYLDFAENIFSAYYIPAKFTRISDSIEWRLKSIIICLSGLLSYYILKIPIFRHQIVSMMIIFICLIFTIIIEIVEFYNEHHKDKGISYIIYVIFLLLINDTFTSGFDVIEKYLLEYNFIYPFRLLMYEGIFGIFFISLFTIYQDLFEQIKIIKNDNPEDLKYLIILLIIFFFLSCGRNIYRIITNKLYSPTDKALSNYIFVPFLIIINYFVNDDFYKTFFYFISNLLLSLIIVFCGIVYNEFIILFCFNLQYDTHIEVSKRAKRIDSKSYELSVNDDSFDESSFNDED